MKELPHMYRVRVEGESENNLTVSSENLPVLEVAAPSEFDGPGDQWSPEELLMAAVANCLVLSFRAIAKASKLEWLAIECETEGELDKVDRKIQFTKIYTKAKLKISSDENKTKAENLLNKADAICFISNSLLAESHFEYEIIVGNE